jgi:hypothetical protein
MIKEIEGYPVGIFQLSEEEIECLQEQYLDNILDLDGCGGCASMDEASLTASGISGIIDPEFFDLYLSAIEKYVYEYLNYYKFTFPHDITFTRTWYNVYGKNDHQMPHDHIETQDTFAVNLVLKQPKCKGGGGLVFQTPSISNHLAYMDLDPNDVWLPIFAPEMKSGALQIFPTCMLHSVYHNQTEESRVVMVTNIKVERTNKEKM